MSDSDDIFGQNEQAPAPRDPDMPDDALGLGLAPTPTAHPIVAEASAPPPLTAPESTPAAPAQTASQAKDAAAYRVLARKYRPQTFRELIGQDAMVQTLGNAIKRDRLAHAFLMTGVRGVGKTSTARLIAKALNCVGPNGNGEPTIDPCGVCEPCRAIAEGRHIDIIEMDAASHTGVDDIREIIEAVRYSSVSARYKIYIIDEVHMLSKNAFNALLKTLEEPPPHVKFIFATTEVDKVPITVLSRCQRFDLKRISAEMLRTHFAQICEKEGVQAELEALLLIAQAAEGSVRDGLSILDQAIAHADMDGDGAITAGQVRDMLGLSDRNAVRRLLGLLLGGDVPVMLSDVKAQYQLGVEPSSIIEGLMTLVHGITLVKSGSPADLALSAEARSSDDELAAKLSFAQLHRLWQMLMKGHEEIARAFSPVQALEMALLRVMHGANMPDPTELARMIKEGGLVAPPAQSTDAPQDTRPPSPPPAPSQKAELPQSFEQLLALFDANNEWDLERMLHDDIRLVEFAPPRIIYQPVDGEPRDFAFRVSTLLRSWTGQQWTFEHGDGAAQPSLGEQKMQAIEEKEAAIRSAPMVRAVLSAFPDAELLPDENEFEHKKASA